MTYDNSSDTIRWLQTLLAKAHYRGDETRIKETEWAIAQANADEEDTARRLLGPIVDEAESIRLAALFGNNFRPSEEDTID